MSTESTARTTASPAAATARNGEAPPTSEAAAVREAESVRRIWAELLQIDAETIDVRRSDFFELGGYSLLALQAIGRLLEERGLDEFEAAELEGALLNRLFEDPTALAQAECLLSASADGPAHT
ncbi:MULTISPECIES: phosphopantetheine-binding protein [unclassified Streptomyces]|uniref:phosphopantetheine-binding protein n=1 Tax=unclassified Streptomyces TaxID=2593676 RepID=UPI0033D9BA64